MAKIVPIETRQSMLEEPSKGSKQTMYFPCQIKASHTVTASLKPPQRCVQCNKLTRTLFSGSTMMAFSSSSDTSTQEVKEDLIMLMTRSFDRTSSFFTWSPVTLVLPAMPYLPGERRGAKITTLHKLIAFLTSDPELLDGACSLWS